MLDLKGEAKWHAWDGKKRLEKEEAMSQYIGLIKNLLEKHGRK